jgi:hypothetical protein
MPSFEQPQVNALRRAETFEERTSSGMSPPKGALTGIDGPDGNKAQPATAGARAAGAVAPRRRERIPPLNHIAKLLDRRVLSYSEHSVLI